jgi:hypothetical protein
VRVSTSGSDGSLPDAARANRIANGAQDHNGHGNVVLILQTPSMNRGLDPLLETTGSASSESDAQTELPYGSHDMIKTKATFSGRCLFHHNSRRLG